MYKNPACRHIPPPPPLTSTHGAVFLTHYIFFNSLIFRQLSCLWIELRARRHGGGEGGPDFVFLGSVEYVISSLFWEMKKYCHLSSMGEKDNSVLELYQFLSIYLSYLYVSLSVSLSMPVCLILFVFV